MCMCVLHSSFFFPFFFRFSFVQGPVLVEWWLWEFLGWWRVGGSNDLQPPVSPSPFFFGRLLLLSSKCVCDTVCVCVTRAPTLPVMNIWHYVYSTSRRTSGRFSSSSFYIPVCRPLGGTHTKKWCAVDTEWCESIDRDFLFFSERK